MAIGDVKEGRGGVKYVQVGADASSRDSWKPVPEPKQTPAPEQPKAPATQAESRKDDPRGGFLGEFGRQAGLTARAGVTGILGLPVLVGEGINKVNNSILGTAGFNERPSVIEGFQSLLNNNFPQPNNGIERVAQDVAGGMAGAAMGAPSASSILAGGSAGASSGVTREAGGGPVAQTFAGLLGGVAGPMVIEAVKGGGRSILGLMEPWLQGGKEKIVGKTLAEFATNPQRAAEAARNATEIIPDSVPTTAQATRDPGLAILERSAAAADPKLAGRLQNRAIEQNAARMAQVDQVAGTPADLAAARFARETEKNARLSAAFEPGKTYPFPTRAAETVTSKIDDVLASPAGDREAVASALKWVKDRIGSVQGKGQTGERLYSIRQDINDAMMGKLSGDQSKFALARKELGAVRDVLDDAIESGAPGFKEYISRFREMSGPVNKMELMQEVRKQIVTAAENANKDEVISLASFKRNVINNPEVQKVLTNPDRIRMEKVLQDLNMGAQSANSGRMVGSDTIQKMSSANLIGRVIGGGLENSVVKSLLRPIDFIYAIPNAQMKEMLADAIMDPSLAKLMMAKASNENLTAIGSILKQRMKDYAVGSAVGTVAATAQ